MKNLKKNKKPRKRKNSYFCVNICTEHKKSYLQHCPFCHFVYEYYQSVLCFLAFYISHLLNFKRLSHICTLVYPFTYMFISWAGMNIVLLNINPFVFRVPISKTGEKQSFIKFRSQVAVWMCLAQSQGPCMKQFLFTCSQHSKESSNIKS